MQTVVYYLDIIKSNTEYSVRCISQISFLITTQVVKLPSMSKKSKRAKAAAAASERDATNRKSVEALEEQPPSYDSICPTGAAQHPMSHVGALSPEDAAHLPRLPTAMTSSTSPATHGGPQMACRYGGDLATYPQQQQPPSATQANPHATTTALDNNHIKLESLSPENLSTENMFEDIHTEHGGSHLTGLPSSSSDCRHLSQSSPTSGYNTMGPSPGVSSPFSLSGSSPQSQYGYPSSCSPNDVHSVASPPNQRSTGSVSSSSGLPRSPPTRSNFPLSPTHLQAIQQRQHKQRVVVQQQQMPSHHPATSAAPPHAYPAAPHHLGAATYPTAANQSLAETTSPAHQYPTPPSQQHHGQPQLTATPEQFMYADIHGVGYTDLHNGGGVYPSSQGETHLTPNGYLDSTTHPVTYPTPSPESPDHWSSSSNEGVYL